MTCQVKAASTSAVVNPASIANRTEQPQLSVTNTTGTSGPTEQLQEDDATATQPNVQAVPSNDSSENKRLTRQRNEKKKKVIPPAHQAPYPPSRKKNPKKKAASAPTTPSRGVANDSSALVPFQPDQNPSSPEPTVSTPQADAAGNQGETTLSEQEFAEQARRLTTRTPTLTTPRDQEQDDLTTENLENLTGVDALGAIMQEAVRR